MDFSLLNYFKNENHISSVASMILDYKFNHDSVELFCGADQVSNVTYEKMGDRWKELFSQFYTQYDKPVEVITFPEVMGFEATQVWEKAMRVLKIWCEKSSGNYGLIIRNYDLKGHLNFSKIKIDMNRKSQQFKERLLLFNPEQRVILTIYLNEDIETIEEEVYNCVNEVNLLGLLLRDELIESGVTVTGIVACSKNNSCKNCRKCKNFIVSSDIFTTVEHFNNFWDSFINQDEIAIRDLDDSDKNKVFEAVASKMLGFLAHLQFKTRSKVKLPTPQKHPKETITNAELLLNRYQMEIVHSNQARIFLIGGYGAGKTIVICKKIELLLKNMKEKELIYYINFEEKSDLDSVFKIRMKQSEKVKVIKGGFNLSHIIKSEIVPKEEKNGTETIHLMVDEFDTQTLSSEEANQLTDIFTKQMQFKNSSIFIAAQPIEISRVAYQKVEGKERKLSEQKHMLGELKRIMDVRVLKYVMRTTKQIYTLAAITQNYLNGKSNQYTHNLELYQTDECSSETITKKASGITESSYITDDLKFHPQKRVDFDVLYKMANTHINENNENYQRSITSFRYYLDSKIGHNISGPLPQLIKVPKLAERLEQIALIAFFLKSIIKIETKRVAIVHFESKAPPWLKKILQLALFRGIRITSDPGKFKNLDPDQDNLKGNPILVTNFKCVKGLEFSDVLLLLNVNEYYLKQFLPEAMTRCMSNLYVLVVPFQKTFNQSPETVSVVLNEWEKINCKRSILKTVELKFCSDPVCKTEANDYCEDGSSTCVHKFTKFYEELYEELQGIDIPVFPADNEKEREEAKVL